MGLHQALADGQPEAGPPQAALRVLAAEADVLPEQARQLLRRHPPALVRDRDRDVGAVARRGDPDGRRLGRVPGGIGQQVVQHLHDAQAVGHNPGQIVGQVDEDRVRAAAAQVRVPGLVHQRPNLRGQGRDRQLAGVDEARVQEVADEAPHVVRLLVDDPEELVQLGRVDRPRGAQHGGGRALDGGKRRTQLVAHHVQELRAEAVELLQRREVLHGDHHGGHRAVLGIDGRGVDQHRDAPPAGRREHDLLGAHGPRLLHLVRQRELVEGDLAPVAEPAGHALGKPLRGAVRRPEGFDDPVRLPVRRHRPAGAGVEYQNAHRGRLDQGLQIGPGAPLLLVGARVDDGGRRLGGEQLQHLLVRGGELGRVLLAGHEEVADLRAAVAHGRPLQGLLAHQLVGEAERAEIVGQVGEPERSRQVAQVREQLRPVGPLGELAVLVGGKAGGDELARLAGLVDGDDEAVARAGEGPRAVGGLLQHGGQVEARAQAQHGRAQGGDALRQDFVLPLELVATLQLTLGGVHYIHTRLVILHTIISMSLA